MVGVAQYRHSTAQNFLIDKIILVFYLQYFLQRPFNRWCGPIYTLFCIEMAARIFMKIVYTQLTPNSISFYSIHLVVIIFYIWDRQLSIHLGVYYLSIFKGEALLCVSQTRMGKRQHVRKATHNPFALFNCGKNDINDKIYFFALLIFRVLFFYFVIY